METNLIKIGNSQGVRLPKAVIEQAGLTEHLKVEVTAGAVIIRAASQARAGWEQAAAECHALGEDQLAEGDSPVDAFHGEWQGEWK